VNTKKHLFYSTCVILIVIAVISPSVLGSFSVYAYPNEVVIHNGHKKYGDLESFELWDGDIYKWKEEWFYYGYLLDLSIYFPDVEDPGTNNVVQLVFKGADIDEIVIFVFYYGETFGDQTILSVPSYMSIRTIPIDNYKAVSRIYIGSSDFWGEPDYNPFKPGFLYIDLLFVGYT